MPTISIKEQNITLKAEAGSNLLEVLRTNGIEISAPCGGKGTCNKCRIYVNGELKNACKTTVDQNLELVFPKKEESKILLDGVELSVERDEDLTDYVAAIDLGTTSVVCYILTPDGKEAAAAGMLNPQKAFGADVVSRIQCARDGEGPALEKTIRDGIQELIVTACQKAGIEPDRLQRVTLVGNPCMQQLFLGLPVDNLVEIPFTPILRKAEAIPAIDVLPKCTSAQFLKVPDISGYVGADTVGCVLSTGMYRQEQQTLMLDIGTNGEMVLGNKDHMKSCATAAGPALEGANITFGMRGSTGAIDRVSVEDGKLQVHVIGDLDTDAAEGICGSGLIDAVAVLLQHGIINKRGRMGTKESCPDFADYLEEVEADGQKQRRFYLTKKVYLSQDDIRQVQLAKGAIAAGIELLIKQQGIATEDVEQVLLAGAFGSYIRPSSACAIGMIPPVLEPKIRAVGNAAGSGAKLLALNTEQWKIADRLCEEIDSVELASLPEFQRVFGKNTNF